MTITELEQQRAARKDPRDIDERLAQLTQESAALEISRTQAQQEADACAVRMEALAHRISAIQVASTTLAGLPPLAPEREWLAHLAAWRKSLCDELLALPKRIRDRADMDRQQHLTFYIRLIDFGFGIAPLGIETLAPGRIGQLMQAAGYAVAGEALRGPNGWRGSMPEVEKRIKELTKQRAAAQARLDEALMSDEERTTHEAENQAFRDTLRTMDIRNNEDPNVPGLVAYTKDGDVLTASEMTEAQRKAFEWFSRGFAPSAPATVVAAPGTTS